VGDRPPGVIDPRRERFRREREMVRVHAVMAGVVFVILFQFLLLMVAIDGHLGAGADRIVPTAIVSMLSFGAVCWLIRAIVVRRAGGPPG
jgi:hypothetical protein